MKEVPVINTDGSLTVDRSVRLTKNGTPTIVLHNSFNVLDKETVSVSISKDCKVCTIRSDK